MTDPSEPSKWPHEDYYPDKPKLWGPKAHKCLDEGCRRRASCRRAMRIDGWYGLRFQTFGRVGDECPGFLDVNDPTTEADYDAERERKTRERETW